MERGRVVGVVIIIDGDIFLWHMAPEGISQIRLTWVGNKPLRTRDGKQSGRLLEFPKREDPLFPVSSVRGNQVSFVFFTGGEEDNRMGKEEKER